MQVNECAAEGMQQQWQDHCCSIASKLKLAADSAAKQDRNKLADLAEQVVLCAVLLVMLCLWLSDWGQATHLPVPVQIRCILSGMLCSTLTLHFTTFGSLANHVFGADCPGVATLLTGVCLCVQAGRLPAGDLGAVQKLQTAIDTLQQSFAASPEKFEAGNSLGASVNDAVPKSPATSPDTQRPSSPSLQQHSPSRVERPADPAGQAGRASPCSSLRDQKPFPEYSGLSSPQVSAGVGAWNPWADDLKSSSSPHYQAGSSDSDWDESKPQQFNPDDCAMLSDEPYGQAIERQEEEVPQNARVASAMAEAQHRLDQLAGLAASHAEVQETLGRQCDLGYAWGLISHYTEHLQRQARVQSLLLSHSHSVEVTCRCLKSQIEHCCRLHHNCINVFHRLVISPCLH